MGLIRTLFILLLIYLSVRYIFRAISGRRVTHEGSSDRLDEGGRERLHVCPTCGTYNAASAAFGVGGEYYCNEQCFEKRGKTS